MRLWMGGCSFAQCILNIYKVVTVLFGCYMAGATWNCCCLRSHFVYTMQPSTSLQCHSIWYHIPRMYACLSVTCHLHFWQNYSCRNTKVEQILKWRVSTEIAPGQKYYHWAILAPSMCAYNCVLVCIYSIVLYIYVCNVCAYVELCVNEGWNWIISLSFADFDDHL